MAQREMRAIRGATAVAADEPALIDQAIAELLRDIVARNALRDDDVVSAIFTATPDLTSAFPAHAARAFGWGDVPLLCATEIPVPGALPRCLRVLVHVMSDVPRARIVHCYLREAVTLRPDIAAPAPEGGA